MALSGGGSERDRERENACKKMVEMGGDEVRKEKKKWGNGEFM